MSNHEFENYLALVSRLLRLNRFQKDSIRDELFDHLETRISELVESGTDANEATRRALEEFGDAAVLAQKFQTVFQFNQRRWMMRFATFSMAATFLAAVLIMAMWPDQARFGPPSNSIAQDENPFAGTADNPFGAETGDATESKETVSAPAPKRRAIIWSDQDIDRKLNEPANMDYEDIPFEEIMAEVRDRHGFNVMLDQSARDDSLDRDTLITFDIQNVRLSTALRLMLRQHNATFFVDDGILQIISMDSSEDPEFYRRKMFHCSQLLEKIARNDRRVGQEFHLAPEFSTFAGGDSKAGKGGGLFCGGVGPLTVPSPSRPQDEQTPNATGDSLQTMDAASAASLNELLGSRGLAVVTAEHILTRLVKTSVSPNSWDDTNGDATMMIVGGTMVVTSSQRMLDEIEQLLAELNATLK